MNKNCTFAICFNKKTLIYITMSRVCSITGKKAMVGNNVSHSQRKTKRTFSINLIKKRFFVPEENQWVTLKLSASALKTINKKGISAVLKKARENGMELK